jgi:hypothetical protein
MGYLAALARTLVGELKETARAGKSPVPEELMVGRADETLRNVISYLRELREEEWAAEESAPEEGGERSRESG